LSFFTTCMPRPCLSCIHREFPVFIPIRVSSGSVFHPRNFFNQFSAGLSSGLRRNWQRTLNERGQIRA
jgi:hypothetical protein